MAEQLQTSTIAAPGFYGLNIQESSVSLSSGFALKALNCIIDKYGRIGSRKGWTPVNTSNLTLGTSGVKSIFEMVSSTGNVVFSSGNNTIFTGTTTLTPAVYRNATNTANITLTFTNDHWQWASLPFGEELDASPHAYAAQAGHPVIVYHKLPATGSGAQITVSTVTLGNIVTYSITTAGSGYAVGDDCTVTGGSGTGAKFVVSSVNGSGGVTGLTMVDDGSGYTATNVLTLVDTDYHSHEGSFGFQRLGDVATLPLGYDTSSFQPNCVLAAFGRIWFADIAGDQQTVYFSDLLKGSDFQGGSSGSLNLGTIIENNDPIVSLASHNGFLIIFTKNNIVIYGNPDNPIDLVLTDVIKGVGCLARDSVQNTGTDIVFLSDTGVRSLQRVIQEKSLPMRDISKNVRDDLMSNVISETASGIKSIYYDRDAFYLLTLPVTGRVYCFDLRTALPDGSARTTTWDDITPTSFCVTQDKKLYLGKAGYIGEYASYLDNGSTYRMEYFTNYFDFDNPTNIKIIKKLGFVIVGGAGDIIAIKWGFDYSENYFALTKTLANLGVSQYNISEYNIAEYTNGIVLDNFRIQAGGTGYVVQIGIECDVNGSAISVQRMDVYSKIGKTI